MRRQTYRQPSRISARLRNRRFLSLAHLYVSKGRVNKAVVPGDDCPALRRARRQRARCSEEDRGLHQRHC